MQRAAIMLLLTVAGAAIGDNLPQSAELARFDRTDVGQAVVYSQVKPGPARISPWRAGGTYSLEFTGAALGSFVAGLAGLATIEGLYQIGYQGRGTEPGAAMFFVTSSLLSATGTHLLGKAVGRHNRFTRALAGAAIGGVAGGGAFIDYFHSGGHVHKAMIPIAIALPALGAVISYNVWRDHGRN